MGVTGPADAPAVAAPGAAPAGRCLNCDAELTGPFCSACGQRAQDPDPSLAELVGEAWEAFVSVDGKFLSSLRLLLLRPGVLTAEYLRGQRVRHFAPLRLYLLCSVAYFLVSSMVPHRDGGGGTNFTLGGVGDTIVLAGSRARAGRRATTADSAAAERAERSARRDSIARVVLAKHGVVVPPGVIDSATRSRADSIRAVEEADRMTALPAWMRARMARGIQHVMRDGKNFGSDYKEQLPRLLFVLMPVFALLLALAYRSRRRRYPVHLVVALHLHAFVFAAFALDELRSLIPWSIARALLNFVVVVWVLCYVPLAFRRVYGGRLLPAVGRTLLLAMEYAIVGTAAFSLLAFVLLMMY